MAVIFLTPDAVKAAQIIADSNDRLIQALERFGNKMADTAEEFAAAFNTFLDNLGTSIDNLGGDVTALKAEIAALQQAAGTLTPEGKAALQAVNDRLESIAATAKALDEQTPPTPPVQL